MDCFCSREAGWNVVKPLFWFTTTKFVVLRDLRLGTILRVIQLGIAAYVVWDIVNRGSYLLTEVPSGDVTPNIAYEQGPRNISGFISKLSGDIAANNLTYCSNSTAYNIVEEGENIDNIKCAFYQLQNLVSIEEQQMLLSSFITSNKLFYLRKAAAADCAATFGTGSFLGYLAGACLYEQSDRFFPLGVDDIVVSLQHSFSTSVVGKSGFLPATQIRLTGCPSTVPNIEFKAGEPVKFTLRQLLSILDITLDENMDLVINRYKKTCGKYRVDDSSKADNGDWPKLRVSGLTIQMTFKYYTFKLAPGNLNSRNDHTIIGELELEPVFEWTDAGTDSHYMVRNEADPLPLIVNAPASGDVDDNVDFVVTRFERNGVALVFSSGGNVGVFDFRSMLDGLINGSVLLSVAQTLVTYMAMYCFGLASKLYTEFMRESVDFKREYARFAAQTIVAGKVYEMLNNDATDGLNRKEVENELHKLLDSRLDPDMIDELADYLVTNADSDKNMDHVTKKTNTINVEEWIEIFTDDCVSLESLKAVIENQYGLGVKKRNWFGPRSKVMDTTVVKVDPATPPIEMKKVTYQ